MKRYLLLFATLLPLFIKAQSTVLSQYQLVPTYVNPSSVGSNPGMRIIGSYRRQWTAMSVPYESKFLSVDAKAGKLFGLGSKVFSQIEGDGRMRSTGVSVAGAVHSYFELGERGKSRLYNFHLGAEIGVLNRRVDLSSLIFSDQIDPSLGVIRPRSEAAIIGSTYNGLMVSLGGGLNGTWGASKKSIWYLGYAANNAGRYSRSFDNNFEVRSQTTHTVRMSLVCNAYDLASTTKKARALKEHYFIFGYRFATQAGFGAVNDLNVLYTYQHLITGLGFRNSLFRNPEDNLRGRYVAVAQAGVSAMLFNHWALQMVYAYDFGLNSQPGLTGHTHEISVSFYNSGFGRNPKPRMNNCHDYTKGNVLPIW